MEMMPRLAFLIVTAAFSFSARAVLDVGALTDVYVEDFGSDAPEQCRPADVDLGHAEARAFFVRAKQVSLQVIHDHYDYAPCYIEGTLKYGSRSCDWEIRAGATGHIVCGAKTWYFACDTCSDLFRTKDSR